MFYVNYVFQPQKGWEKKKNMQVSIHLIYIYDRAVDRVHEKKESPPPKEEKTLEIESLKFLKIEQKWYETRHVTILQNNQRR